MSGRVWEVHHSPCNLLIPPRGNSFQDRNPWLSVIFTCDMPSVCCPLLSCIQTKERVRMTVRRFQRSRETGSLDRTTPGPEPQSNLEQMRSPESNPNRNTGSLDRTTTGSEPQSFLEQTESREPNRPRVTQKTRYTFTASQT